VELNQHRPRRLQGDPRRKRRLRPQGITFSPADEPTVRVLAVSIIEDDLGYAALSAATAREAIALLEQDRPIDLLFRDINLSDGPDAVYGLELARRAVEIRPGYMSSTPAVADRQTVWWPFLLTARPIGHRRQHNGNSAASGRDLRSCVSSTSGLVDGERVQGRSG
jgi:CheY-like chemotaxis protein